MPSLSTLIEHWGYAAVFVVVILGNVGLPVPEETILTLAGYLVWRGELNGPLVVAVGIVSAVAGDNLGYWLGRRYGAHVLRAYAERLGVNTAHLTKAQRFVERHGGKGVFVARFVPGLRFAAGPASGIIGLSPRRFVVANVLGAMVYVPTIVGAGYLLGQGVGMYLERLREVALAIEWIVLVASALVIGVLAWRRARRLRRPLPRA